MAFSNASIATEKSIAKINAAGISSREKSIDFSFLDFGSV